MNGRFARGLVEERFSLRRAAVRQLELYEAALAGAPLQRRNWMAPAIASASGLTAYRFTRRLNDVLGRGSVDDFNSRMQARLMLLPPHDPQFRRNRERVKRDAERENITLSWDPPELDIDPAPRER